jgi:hypothetical protein
MGTSIAKVGFFGESYQKLWCLTHIETLGYNSSPLLVFISSMARYSLLICNDAYDCVVLCPEFKVINS